MKLKFRISYNTAWGESLSLVLDDVKHPMEWTGDGVWTVKIDASKGKELIYRYIVIEDGLIKRTEWDYHHTIAGAESEIEDSWIDNPDPACPFLRRHNAPFFDKPHFRGAGVAVPVFSLRSENDFGIGEFYDLKILVDWAVMTGQKIIQLLPVNDTTRQGTWKDSYPYSPVSSFALNPLYINLQELGVRADVAFNILREELNSCECVDYPRVFAEKMRLIRAAYEESSAKELKSRPFKTFFKANSYWLKEYAQFCARRDGEVEEYYYWVQYHLDKQFSEVASYARSKGICLKGDLPIGVSADSADAYWHPELFNLDSCAGAPPDFFSVEGQNWGFPTYNWEAMAKDDYAWWKSRLRKMAEYFDAFRIDHILGFFRIWEIPCEFKSGQKGHFNPALPYREEEIKAMGLPVEGLFLPDPRNEGCWQPAISPALDALEWWQKDIFNQLHTDFFFHRHNDFWRRNALKKLPELLSATGMLACGEDLGMVPDCVPGVMDRERILTLEMPCMEKGRPWPELSVCSTSSHDMQTLRMQSEQDPSPQDCKAQLMRCLESVSMLAIFPIQDWLSLNSELRRPDRDAERINEPADPEHHWRYRMHLGLESLCSEGAALGLREEIAQMLAMTGRK